MKLGVLIIPTVCIWLAFSFSASAQQEQVESIPFYGVVSYYKLRPVYSQFDGVLVDVYVKGGDRLEPNQPLVKIQREEIGYEAIFIRNTLESAVVSRLDVQEGHKVNRFSQIMMIADYSQYLVKIDVSQQDLLKLREIGNAEVIFSPSSAEPLIKTGKLHSINEPNQGDFGLYQVEIIVDCAQRCAQQIRSGSIAKVILHSAHPMQKTAMRSGH
ncbi:hypothetical protein Sden_3465 [Shewanella denitrificans OS217]|jgi:hypothetical protein|uniref:Membrane fusion protein biotin-lipoyl like domain-containing protein n=1 Tax=Shewanella denitrificans (strain OS217 / ATCC BAA-1090 / DSM 15013) TaxID=318161 RepID=Q12II6_SHEDO|nr:HlyD family efflux transporter periplasmic adaptor subunit [Shewanella denitrificans]ABE56740.1 hypothetical protein Sden_3465 [Shewanella denitrificans OS217]